MSDFSRIPTNVRAVGIAWFRREDYHRARKLFKDGHKLSTTFDQWLKRAEYAKKELEARGHIVEKAYIDPDTFPAWCVARGLDIDASARTQFANDFVARKYLHEH